MQFLEEDDVWDYFPFQTDDCISVISEDERFLVGSSSRSPAFSLLAPALRSGAGLQRGVVRRFLGLLSGVDSGLNGSVQ